MHLDYLVVSIYLLVTLTVGFWKGSGLKSLKDYAVANVHYSTFAIVATLCATLMGGGTTFGIAEKVYKYGLVYVLVVGGATINQIAIGQFIVPRIKNLKSFISVGEIMRSFYGKDIQIITGICAALISLGFVSTQVSAIGYIINHFLGMNYFQGVLIGYGLVILYSAFGGMRSVVATDIIQFAILIVAIPIICSLGINKLGGFESFASNLPASALKIDFFNKDHLNEFVIFLIVGVASPAFIQRILIAEDTQQAKRAITINGLISFPFYFIIGLIGLIAFEIAPNIDPNQALPYLIQNILPIGIKGFVIAGILSVLMSSADSEINVAGVSIMNDVLRPSFNLRLTDRQELFVSRFITTILGVGTIAVAMHFKNIIDIMFYAFTFWAPTILVPLVFRLYGFRVNRAVFYLGFLTSLLSISIFSGMIKERLGVDPIISSVALTLVFYISYFAYKDKGKFLLNIPKYLIQIISSCSIKPILRSTNFLWRNIKINVFKNSVNENYYEYFGVFCFLFYLLPYFLWSHSDDKYSLIIILRIIACLLCFFLIMYKSWGKKYKKYLPVYWNFSLIFCLPFVSTFLLLHNNLSLPWLMNSIIALFILVMLVNWSAFIFILVCGISLAFILYSLVASAPFINVEIYEVVFGLLMYSFSLAIGMIFLYKREQLDQLILDKNKSLKKLNRDLETLVEKRTEHLVEALNAKQEFLNNMSHEIRTPIHGVYNISQGLFSQWKEYPEKKRVEYLKILSESGHRLKNLVDNVLDFSKINAGKASYHFKKISLKKIINEAIEYSKGYADLNSLKVKILLEKFTDTKIYCDKEKLLIAVQNVLTNAIKYGGSKVLLKVSQAKENIVIEVIDEGIGIPRKELETIFDPFVESSYTKSKAGGKGLGLALCREIIKAHKGKVEAKNNLHKKGASFKITLPI
ncbi:MAG: ATP-binding protein [Rickettsiales bacterium]